MTKSSRTLHYCHVPKTGGTSLHSLSRRFAPLKVYGHDYDPTTIKGSTVIVIREPTDRFSSAYRYNLQENKSVYYNNLPYLNILDLLAGGVTTPNDFIECILDSSHPQHRAAQVTLRNIDRFVKEPDGTLHTEEYRHNIGGAGLKWRYEFTPQSEWFCEPTYVILFENYEEEMHELFEHMGFPPLVIPKLNTTKEDIEFSFSQDSLSWLKDVYSKDYEIYNKFKAMSLDERLHRNGRKTKDD